MILLQFTTIKNKNGKVTIGDLPPVLAKRKTSSEVFTEEVIKVLLDESGSDLSTVIDFEGFLKVRVYSTERDLVYSLVIFALLSVN